MSHVPHELSDEFPQAIEAMRQLKASDPRFAKLADSYHSVNREIHRIETEVAPASDEALENLKKQRLSLKDEIAALISAAEVTGT